MNQNNKKAELLDRFIAAIKATHVRTLAQSSTILSEELDKLQNEYNSITNNRSYTENPFVDEIMSGRILGHISDWFEGYRSYTKANSMQTLRVSHLPPPEYFDGIRGFGRKSMSEYKKVFEHYTVAGIDCCMPKTEFSH